MRFAAKKAAIEIDAFLKRNYIILLETLGKNKTQIKVSRNDLEKKKFRFKYHTHSHINSKNKTYRYVYDLGWMEFSDDEILVVRKQ